MKHTTDEYDKFGRNYRIKELGKPQYGIQESNLEIARRNRISKALLGRRNHKNDRRTVTGRDIEKELCGGDIV